MKTTINQIVMQEINKSALVKAIKRKLTAEHKSQKGNLCVSLCVYLLQLLLLL